MVSAFNSKGKVTVVGLGYVKSHNCSSFTVRRTNVNFYVCRIIPNASVYWNLCHCTLLPSHYLSYSFGQIGNWLSFPT